ncbi:CbiET protein, partial [mine drainage metagenome]
SSFGLADRIRTIHGKAPEKLPVDPRPDRIFIGGTGGRLSELLDLSLEVLPPDGKVVINLATFENISEVLDWTRKKGSLPKSGRSRQEEEKPFWDFTGSKP